MAKNEIIDLLKKYVILLNASGIPVAKAFLYGSQARNDATENSDIDVMVISQAFDTDDDKLRAKAWILTERVDVRIEPYTIGISKFLYDDVSPLLQVVKKEGIEIIV